MRVDVGAVNRRMTTRAPASSLHQSRGMRKVAHDYRAGRGQLSVAFQTQIVVALVEHLLVDRTMGVVTHGASLTQCLVFKYMRPGLLAVTLETGLILPRDEHAFGLEDILSMRIVAINAMHPSFFDRVAVLKVEQRPGLKMALETGLRIFAGINYKLTAASAHFQVEAAGAMTRLAAPTHQALSFSLNPYACVAGVFEILNHLLMAQRARFYPHILCTRNHGRGNYHAPNGSTGYNEYQC
jgi:hypothetical protein